MPSKTFSSFFCSFFSLLLIAPLCTASLIAHYTFDDTSARYADSSGNGYTGAQVGAVSFVAGVSGQAMSVADSGKMVYSAGAGLPVSMQNFTVSFWATDSTTSWDSWVEMNAGAGASEVGIHLQSTGSDRVAVYNADGGTPIPGYTSGSLLSSSPLIAGFNHIALTASGGTARIYLGGTQVATAPWTVTANIGLFTVGGLFRDGVRNVSAQIDDVQVYSTALTPSDIAFLAANPGSVVPEPASLGLLVIGLFLLRRLYFAS